MPKLTFSELSEDNFDASQLPQSTRVAYAIIENLRGRAGFDHWWDQIESDVLDELFAELEDVAAEELGE